jgi:hypothetical protein
MSGAMNYNLYQKPDGFGKADRARVEVMPAESIDKPSAYSSSLARLRGSLDQILQEHGQCLTLNERIQLVGVASAALIPRRKADRKPLPRITRAYEAWKAGKRGIALYREFIPNWERLSYWRREGEKRRLMAAIHSRRRRDAKRSRPES